MQVNPDKFQVLSVGKRSDDKQPVFSIQDVNIICNETLKLLGIGIDFFFNLMFISQIYVEKQYNR
jgi:hypothetical protein